MNYKFELLKEEKAYWGFMKIKRLELRHELYRGGMSPVLVRECSGRRGIVAALVCDRRAQRFIFVEQFRVGAMVAGEGRPWMTEIVAGIMDRDGESPDQCMAREIQEELGVTAHSLELLTSYYPSLGGSGSKTYLYLAEVDSGQLPEYTGLLEEGEDIRVVQYSLADTLEHFRRGNLFNNSNTIIALQTFLLRGGKL